MNKKLIAGTTLAGLILSAGITGMAVAQSNETTTTAPKLDMTQAIEIAVAEVPGTVTEAELENEDGTLIYEIEIETADGVEMEVELNADTGEVLEVAEDDNDRKGKKGKKGKKKMKDA